MRQPASAGVSYSGLEPYILRHRKDAAMAHVLIIDDDPQMRRLISRMLVRAGHAACEAVNGREAITTFRRLLPALVITDIVMPDMEGIETIRQLREVSPTTPILAMSGSTEALYLRAATE